MASTYSNLKFELIGTGDQSGTWGSTTNTNLGIAIDQSISGTVDISFSSSDVTLTLSNSNSSQSVRNLRLNLTGTSGGARNLTIPASFTKFYVISNNLADIVTVQNPTGTTYAIPAGRVAQVYCTGTGVYPAIDYLSGAILSSAAVILGGSINATAIGNLTPSTGAFTTLSTTGALTYGGVTLSNAVTGTGNMVLSTSPTLTGTPLAPTASPGTNTTQIATTAFVTAATSTLGTMSTQNANAVAITGGTLNNTSIGATTPLTGAFTALSSTGITTFNALVSAGETTTISATAAAGTIIYDVATQGVVYYTTNASANWTLNARASSTSTLNSIMAVGETRTITHLVTQGTTAYYNNVVQVDGTTSGVTTKWQGATPVAGNPSGIDVYTYSIIKTASATFTVLAAQTQFK